MLQRGDEHDEPREKADHRSWAVYACFSFALLLTYFLSQEKRKRDEARSGFEIF